MFTRTFLMSRSYNKMKKKTISFEGIGAENRNQEKEKWINKYW